MNSTGFYTSAELHQWFVRLDALLATNRAYWQFKPFHHRQWQWADSAPQLCRWLNGLSDSDVAELEQDLPQLTAKLAPWLSGGSELLQLCQLPRLPVAELKLPPRLDNGVPGRKWQQVLAFAGCLPQPVMARPLLEWCAGKGHLGRVLSLAQRRPVRSLEWQQSLCDEGAELAQRAGAAMDFVCADALAAEAAQWLQPDGDAVALHACGDLHTTLMQHWLARRGRALGISPCCYHLIRSAEFVPMSAQGRAAQVKLHKDDLQLPLQETVTAGAGVRRKGEQEMLWRLAFDEWQRDWRGIDSYLPLPNLQKSLLTGSFTDFVHWAAEVKHLSLSTLSASPSSSVLVNEEEWLARGRQRLQRVRRMELVAHVFRRPLELWLVLDRALYLSEELQAARTQEQKVRAQESTDSIRIRLGEFCARELTPRNILLYVER